MSSEARLAGIRAFAEQRIPPDKWAMMQQATADLRASGIMRQVIKPGEALPPFALTNAHGVTVKSQDVLSRGGSWSMPMVSCARPASTPTIA